MTTTKQWATLADSVRDGIRHLENYRADMSGLHRLSSIFDVHPTVIALPQDLSEPVHQCNDMECCPDDPTRRSTSWGPVALNELAQRGWVYAYITERGTVAYVGKTTCRLQDRLRQHDRDQWKAYDSAGRVGNPWMLAHSIPHKGTRTLLQCLELVAAWHLGADCHRYEKAAILATQPILNTKDAS